MTEYGIFNNESADYTAEEALEAGFYSEEEARKAITARYPDDDDLEVREVEEPEDEEEDEEEDDEAFDY